jgi:hypothetical protein
MISLGAEADCPGLAQPNAVIATSVEGINAVVDALEVSPSARIKVSPI